MTQPAWYAAQRQNYIEALLEAGRRAAMESNNTHPEDIATAIMFAVEGAANTIMVLHEKGLLK